MRVIALLLICAGLYSHNYASDRPRWIREGSVWILEFPDGTWIWPAFSLSRKRSPSPSTYQEDLREPISYEADE